MFEPKLPASVDDIHLDELEFWTAPIEEREGAFALLRRERPMSFHEEFEPPPEIPLPQGPGLLVGDAPRGRGHGEPARATSSARARACRSPICPRSSTSSSAR